MDTSDFGRRRHQVHIHTTAGRHQGVCRQDGLLRVVLLVSCHACLTQGGWEAGSSKSLNNYYWGTQEWIHGWGTAGKPMLYCPVQCTPNSDFATHETPSSGYAKQWDRTGWKQPVCTASIQITADMCARACTMCACMASFPLPLPSHLPLPLSHTHVHTLSRSLPLFTSFSNTLSHSFCLPFSLSLSLSHTFFLSLSISLSLFLSLSLSLSL